MQMIGYKVLLKNICPPMPPTKTSSNHENVVLFWLLDITYLCLHYNYICLRFCLSQKHQNWWFFDFEIYFQKLRTMYGLLKNQTSRYPRTQPNNCLCKPDEIGKINWPSKTCVHIIITYGSTIRVLHYLTTLCTWFFSHLSLSFSLSPKLIMQQQPGRWGHKA
jgi:hypothetical protein